MEVILKKLEEYKQYVLIGGGTVANRMRRQLVENNLELIGVADNLDDNRKIKEYQGFVIHNLLYYI